MNASIVFLSLQLNMIAIIRDIYDNGSEAKWYLMWWYLPFTNAPKFAFVSTFFSFFYLTMGNLSNKIMENMEDQYFYPIK